MTEIAPGVWTREFPPNFFSSGRALRFTYYWPQVGRWEGRDFVISVVRRGEVTDDLAEEAKEPARQRPLWHIWRCGGEIV